MLLYLFCIFCFIFRFFFLFLLIICCFVFTFTKRFFNRKFTRYSFATFAFYLCVGLLLLLFCFLSNVNNSLKSSNFREKKRANEDMLVFVYLLCMYVWVLLIIDKWRVRAFTRVLVFKIIKMNKFLNCLPSLDKLTLENNASVTRTVKRLQTLATRWQRRQLKDALLKFCPFVCASVGNIFVYKQ